MVTALFKGGVHEPLMPLVDMFGKEANEESEQIGGMGLKVGTTEELTVMVNVVVEAHCPALGVNV